MNEHTADIDALAAALHRERCDMGHKDWEGCREAFGRGCEDIAARIVAGLRVIPSLRGAACGCRCHGGHVGTPCRQNRCEVCVSSSGVSV